MAGPPKARSQRAKNYQNLKARHDQEREDLQRRQQEEWETLIQRHEDEQRGILGRYFQKLVVGKNKVSIGLGPHQMNPQSSDIKGRAIASLPTIQSPAETTISYPQKYTSGATLQTLPTDSIFTASSSSPGHVAQPIPTPSVNGFFSGARSYPLTSQSSQAGTNAQHRQVSIDNGTHLSKSTSKSLENIAPSVTNPTRKQSPLRDDSPEIAISVFRQQQIDRSKILKSPPTIPRDQSLLALETQKKNGSFVNNILYNERSHSWAPELQNAFQRQNQDVLIEDVPIKREEKKSLVIKLKANYREESAVETGGKSQESQTRSQKMRQQSILKAFERANRKLRSPFASPPSASTSAVNRTIQGTPKSKVTDAQFKVPALPRTPSSESALEDLMRLRQQREPSITSQRSTFSTFSQQTAATTTTAKSRKRKTIISLSDDSESDPEFEPSPPPSSSRSREKVPTRKLGHATKKVKTTNGSTGSATISSSSAPHTPPSRKKNSAPSTPATPKRNRYSFSFTSYGSTSPSVRASSTRASRTSTIAPRPKRAARVNAENRIKEDAEKTLQFQRQIMNETEIEDEEVVNVDARVKDVGSRMRNMSITPTPDLRRDLSQVDGAESGDERGSSAYRKNDWVRDRAMGDRFMAKSQSIAGDRVEYVEGEGQGELNSGRFQIVNGLIVEAGKEEKEGRR